MRLLEGGGSVEAGIARAYANIANEVGIKSPRAIMRTSQSIKIHSRKEIARAEAKECW